VPYLPTHSLHTFSSPLDLAIIPLHIIWLFPTFVPTLPSFVRYYPTGSLYFTLLPLFLQLPSLPHYIHTHYLAPWLGSCAFPLFPFTLDYTLHFITRSLLPLQLYRFSSIPLCYLPLCLPTPLPVRLDGLSHTYPLPTVMPLLTLLLPVLPSTPSTNIVCLYIVVVVLDGRYCCDLPEPRHA